jgi:hypothetical protein
VGKIADFGYIVDKRRLARRQKKKKQDAGI